MESKAVRDLAERLAGTVLSLDPWAPARMRTRLARLSGRDWLRLDESMRRQYRSPLDDVTGWPSRLGADDGGIAAAAGSMYRDGRVREAAVAVLAGTPGPVAAAALAVRAADWVAPVRSAAAAAVRERTAAEDVVVIVPVLLAMEDRLRGRLAAKAILAGLAAGAAGTLAGLSAAGERGSRLWALSARAGRDLLTAGELEARAMGDRDPVVAAWCATQLAARFGWQPAGAGPRLLGSARAAVRAFALEHLDDDLLPREVLRGMLADRSGMVRAVARWRWARAGQDPGPVYRELLTAPRPRPVAAALDGLDDLGDDSLPEAAWPFLAHPSPRVRYAAVLAVGRHSPPGDLPARLSPALRDESGKVAGAALRYLRGYRLAPAVLEELDAAGTRRSRLTALAIRQRLSPWDRVGADLTAIGDPDPELARTGRADLLSWLRRDAATAYGRPSAEQAALIAARLAASPLTSEQRRKVAFVTGIRPEPPG
jgi:hypothetical protein